MTKTISSFIGVLAVCSLVFSCATNTPKTAQTAGQKPEMQAVDRGGSSCPHSDVPTLEKPGDPRRETFDGEGFTLVYPKGVHIEKKPRVADFDVYRFISQGEVILCAYVGNHPDTLLSWRAASPGHDDGFVNALPYQRLHVQNPDGTWRTEVLIRFTDGRFYPAFVHFWYAGLTPSIQEVAEGIIASLTAQENGAFPNPEWAESNPRKWLRWMIGYAERRLQELRDAGGANIGAFHDASGAVVPAEARIREQEQYIQGLREQLRAYEEG